MAITIRAYIKNGRIEPLEAVELPEGGEVEVVIPAPTTTDLLDGLRASRSRK